MMDCEGLLLKAHLLSRGFDADRLRVVLGSGVATFYLWGFDGRLRGYQHYKPHAEKNCKNPKDARYFTRTTRPCLWGLEYLPRSGTVFVTESIFKAVALMNCGFNAVSALGSNIPADLRQQMSLLPYEWVCAGDNDKAGLKFSKTFTRGFVSNDLDELCEEEITYLARKFTI